AGGVGDKPVVAVALSGRRLVAAALVVGADQGLTGPAVPDDNGLGGDLHHGAGASGIHQHDVVGALAGRGFQQSQGLIDRPALLEHGAVEVGVGHGGGEALAAGDFHVDQDQPVLVHAAEHAEQAGPGDGGELVATLGTKDHHDGIVVGDVHG